MRKEIIFLKSKIPIIMMAQCVTDTAVTIFIIAVWIYIYIFMKIDCFANRISGGADGSPCQWWEKSKHFLGSGNYN